MKIKYFIFVMLIIFIVTIVGGLTFLNDGQKEVSKTVIKDIDLSKYDDGIYTGKFDGYRWSNTVAVIVNDHKITNIKIIEGQQFRIEEVEKELISNVISNQSIDIDAVSGATVSSKAILKAIENAFDK